MADSLAEIELFGTTATLSEIGWVCSDKKVKKLLDFAYGRPPKKGIEDPVEAQLEKVQRLLGAAVIKPERKRKRGRKNVKTI